MTTEGTGRDGTDSRSSSKAVKSTDSPEKCWVAGDGGGWVSSVCYGAGD